MSIMGHRIKIMPYSTFRLNLSVTSPYNADFDGDEMNMHVPQSVETKAEVLELMMVPKCIVSPQSNRPVIAIVQDTLLGCRMITKRDTFIEKDVFMNILMWWGDFDGKIPAPAILKPRPLWTGKQVFGLIIPKQINLMRTSAWHPDSETDFITPGDTQVRIERGELLTGILCKKTLGTSTGSLIHVVWEEVGPDAARKFLGNTQWLVNYWLLQNGFSIGIGDTVADAATMEIINKTISNAKTEVNELIRTAQENQLGPEPGLTRMESFENRVNQVLNKARDDAGSRAEKSLSESNNLKAMVTAGSKGSSINISQMTACVGQQNVEGKRIPYGFNGRSLPHFTKDDYGPESRGEGLIDTAVKTSETGYIQRRLVKAMEDIMVKYDGTVRNSLGDVVQFLYGEDGIDAVWIESQTLDSLNMKKSEFDEAFRYELHNENWNPSYILPEHVEGLKTVAEFRNLLDAEFQKLESDRYQLRMEIATGGEMVGCVAAQSVGEPATQMTLNTFHYAGVSSKNVTLGVPRLREIINVAKKIKTPSLSVYLNPEKTKEKAKNVQCALEYTTLRTVTLATEMWYDPHIMTTIIEEDLDFVTSYYEMPAEEVDPEKISPWLLRIELNREMMVKKNLSIADISEKINLEFADGLTCICSDDNAEKLILRIRIINDESPIGKDDPADNDVVLLEKIESVLLADMALQGIPDISKVFIKQEKGNRYHENEGLKLELEEEWMVDTEGVNLLAVMCHEDVDAKRTTSNHLIEVLEVLGIEAARRALLDELRKVLSFDGSYVNYRHLAVLCDTMTYRGHLMAITRHGINRNDTGPLMRCSFEETVDILLGAAVYAETDHLRGVTENIMLGQLAPIGTGDCAMYLNDQMLLKSVDLQLPSYFEGGGFDFSVTPSSHVTITPYHASFQDYSLSPNVRSSPITDASFSPYVGGMGTSSAAWSPLSSGYNSSCRGYIPNTPSYRPSSLGNDPYLLGYSPTSPIYSPYSPVIDSNILPYSPTSPSYWPTSPRYSLTAYSPTSPSYDQTRPSYILNSPSYILNSPSYLTILYSEFTFE
ncbi:hypothetical protein IFM89_033759 [Coptis chinensis]|uniref:DNA-directed RNA polymerase II subunit RPB1 n=1 Tax=Coptis chinensis TaxID=261450 RepID=A0A835HR35_9MAGN|nr:hypothetical protein IFM89_033759 [Coptis chinensis]